MEIKILGGGCKNCERLEKLTREAVEELNLTANFSHVKNINDIMAYDILSTPALVINEDVLFSGKVPQKNDIVDKLKQYQAN